MTTSLKQWRTAFRSLDRTPWPGPRPMTKDDSGLLVGRERDAAKFTDDVLSHKVVLLTGDSGVGKSSLLVLGLIPQLEEDGFASMLCNDWSSTDRALHDPEAFIAEKVKDQLPPGVVVGPGAPSLCEQLDAEYGTTAVLVLDQFEELIRYQPALFHRVWEWVTQVSRTRETHIVLSLRSEYEHRLRNLDSQVNPFQLARYPLKPLKAPKDIEQVIRSADAPGRPAVTDDAVALLLSAWKQAGDSEDWAFVGLLQLQATLYVLHARAGRGVVEAPHVAELVAQSFGRPFEFGLAQAVGLKLDRCVATCSSPELDRPLDDVLVTGTRSLIQRMVGQLSSGRYKLVREQYDLALAVLRRELDLLDLEPSTTEQVFRLLAGLVVEQGDDDLLSAARSRLEATLWGATGVPASELATQEVEGEAAPWVADPDDSSCGPMLGMAPRRVVIEELRRFFFALEWLKETSLVRSSTPTSNQTMVSLVHDGFSLGLEGWASDPTLGPAEALRLLTAARGESFVWQADRSDQPDFSELDGGEGHLTVVNVRWRYCRISASMRHVVFVNCDFRGSRFERCGFRGVVFVNCLLDGVTFGDCTIYGPVTPPTEHLSTDLPSFLVDVPAEVVDTLGHYRETSIDTDELFSATSGVPAVPKSGGIEGDVQWTPQSGGLTMYGGRLSSLMVRHCSFVDGGTLAFRHIAGSSLEFAEQSTGRVEVYGAAIRGLSVSRSVDEADRAVGDITFDVKASVIANAWFGDGMSGGAAFQDTVLWQLVNSSDRDHFDVVVDNCRYYGLVNVRPPQDSTAETEFGLTSLGDGRSSVVASGLRMDYRSVPARLELRERALRGRR